MAQANDCIWVEVGNGENNEREEKEETLVLRKRKFVLELILRLLLSVHFMLGPIFCLWSQSPVCQSAHCRLGLYYGTLTYFRMWKV